AGGGRGAPPRGYARGRPGSGRTANERHPMARPAAARGGANGGCGGSPPRANTAGYGEVGRRPTSSILWRGRPRRVAERTGVAGGRPPGLIPRATAKLAEGQRAASYGAAGRGA